jgi:hypothetical protein
MVPWFSLFSIHSPLFNTGVQTPPIGEDPTVHWQEIYGYNSNELLLVQWISVHCIVAIYRAVNNSVRTNNNTSGLNGRGAAAPPALEKFIRKNQSMFLLVLIHWNGGKAIGDKWAIPGARLILEFLSLGRFRKSWVSVWLLNFTKFQKLLTWNYHVFATHGW